MHDYSMLKFGSWYVVDVSFRKTNPIHRAILSEYRSDGNRATLTGNYEPASLEFLNLDDLYYFKVITEIPEMIEKSSMFLPPPNSEKN